MSDMKNGIGQNHNIASIIKEKIGIVDYIGRYMAVERRSGNRYVALCPFHKERTPSFCVTPEKGFFYCFGCGASGDVITFAKLYHGGNYSHVIELLAREAGIDMRHFSSAKRNGYEIALSATRWLMNYYCDSLDIEGYKMYLESHDYYKKNDGKDYYKKNDGKNDGKNDYGGRAHEDGKPLSSQRNLSQVWGYIRERNLSPELIQMYKIGYAPKNMDDAMRELLKLFPESILLQNKIILSGEYGLYIPMRNRLVFPILDRHGNPVGFSARVINADDAPKYINSSENEIFSKKSLLYGLSVASEFLSKNSRAIKDISRSRSFSGIPYIVTEGCMDVVSIAKSGCPTGVAPLGTALRVEHILTLWAMTNVPPVLCMDNDIAGQNATFRLLMELLPYLTMERMLNVCVLPMTAKDPDEYIESTMSDAETKRLLNGGNLSVITDAEKSPWMNLITKRTISMPEYLFSAILRKYSNDIENAPNLGVNDRIAMRRELHSILDKIQEPVVRSEYARYFTSEYKRLDRTFSNAETGARGKGDRNYATRNQKENVKIYGGGDRQDKIVKSAKLSKYYEYLFLILYTVYSIPNFRRQKDFDDLVQRELYLDDDANMIYSVIGDIDARSTLGGFSIDKASNIQSFLEHCPRAYREDIKALLSNISDELCNYNNNQNVDKDNEANDIAMISSTSYDSISFSGERRVFSINILTFIKLIMQYTVEYLNLRIEDMISNKGAKDDRLIDESMLVRSNAKKVVAALQEKIFQIARGD